MRTKNPGEFRIKQVTTTSNGFSYQTHRLTGWLDGRRIRQDFKSHAEALGQKNVLEVEAANVGGEIRARNTRLSAEQLAEAEGSFARLAGKSMSQAVDWFLTTYRPPTSDTKLEAATAAFLADKEHGLRRVRPVVLRDYKNTFKTLNAAFPDRFFHSISTTELRSFLLGRGVGLKRFKNLRGDLNALFAFGMKDEGADDGRPWRTDNPVTPIAVPNIVTETAKIMATEQAKAVMAYVETYAGDPRRKLAPGCLAPYFALALFAGIRPSLPHGELSKLGERPDLAAIVRPDLGVIRIPAELSKTKEVRQVTIQPNLAAWLERYPLSKFPLKVSRRMVQHVRERFDLGDDVLRHTFCSMHVGKFRSVGDTALQAGNSERIIRKHYLNTVTVSEAEGFWSIRPT
jgi:hypothetical protein